jgi:C-terminal processing protease CtpA/Prc
VSKECAWFALVLTPCSSGAGSDKRHSPHGVSCGADVAVGPGITLVGYTDADGVGVDWVTGMLRGPPGTPVKLTLAERGHLNRIKVRSRDWKEEADKARQG